MKDNNYKMDVSIIIVNYNTVSLLCDAVDSVIEKTENVEYEIIVVDNNSSDNSENIISQKYGDKLVYVKIKENIGFGRANNEGAKYAKGKYLFLLNPDVILLNNAVRYLADFLDNNTKVGICGGNLFDIDKNATHSYAMLLPSVLYEINLLFSRGLEKLIYGRNYYFNHTNKARKVGYITGADLMIRTNLFRNLNGFDADFFMYFEETELTYRVKKAGYEVYSVPQAKIIHLEGQALSNNWKKILLLLEGRRKYYQKTHNRVSFAIANGIVFLTCIVRIVLFTLARNKEKVTLWKFILNNLR